MDYTSLASPERLAMLFAATAEAIAKRLGGNPPTSNRLTFYADLMVIGLPVPLMTDETQFNLVKAGLRPLKAEHEFKVNDQECKLSIERIKVIAQPVGAYSDWLITDKLAQRTEGKNSEVAILDIGMNTLDLYVVESGVVTPRFIGGAKVGVRRLLQLINRNG